MEVKAFIGRDEIRYVIIRTNEDWGIKISEISM